MLPTRQQAIRAERELIKRRGFAEFVKRAWPIVEQNPMLWNWHMDEVCDVLMGAARDRAEGLPREIGIMVPPASTKSLIASIMYQPWVWTWWPASRWITVTYEGGPGSVALYQCRKSKELILSDWYQDRWPLELSKDSESYIANVHGGERRAVGIGGAITGKHAHFHIGDDLIAEQLTRIGTPDAIMKAVQKAVGYWWGTLATREVDQGKTARVIVEQGLCVGDPQHEAQKRGYEMVVFPAHHDLSRHDPRDHRTEEGELLHPERADEDYYKKKALELGPTAASAQLEQNPVPLGGRLLLERYLSNRYHVLPSRIKRALETGRPHHTQRWLTAWDLTFDGKKTSDYVVGQLWCAVGAEYYIIDQVRGQMGFMETLRVFKDFVNRYPFVNKHLVEKAANASGLEDSLKSEIAGIILVKTGAGNGCLGRTQQVEGVWESRSVILPAEAPWMGGGDGFVAEHLAFDGLGTRHDDQVAASSLALCHLTSKSSGQWLANMKRVMANQ